VLKDLDSFVFADTRSMKARSANSPPHFPRCQAHAIFIGGTGTGKPISASRWPQPLSAHVPGAASSTSSIWSTSSSRKRRPAAVAVWPEKLLRYDLIVIDELGYLPFSQAGGQLLFHLISKLYENTRC